MSASGPADGPTLVLEFGHDPAVAFAGRLLALTGMRVVKVESLETDQVSRAGSGQHCAEDRSEPAGTLFHYLNQGKQSVSIDTSRAGGVRLAGELIGRSAIVLVDATVASTAPWATLIPQCRSGVEVRITAFGLAGPRSSEPATPATVFASSGEGSILPGGAGYQLHPDWPPLLGRGHLVDFDAGVIAATCATAALASREESARVIDVSKQEAEASLNRWLVSHFAASGWIESRATRSYAFAGLMECSDGYVMLQPTTDAHWAGLKSMMGNPEWAESPDYDTQDRRLAGGMEIQERLAEWAAGRPGEEIFSAALAHNVPAAPFRSMAQVAACPQYSARRFLVPYAGSTRMPGLPFQPHPAIRAKYDSAPDLGQDTDSILAEYGLSDLTAGTT